MNQIANCPNCDKIFVKTSLRELCEDCYKEEQMYLERVIDFLKRKANRIASMKQIMDGTGVDIELIEKFIKAGKIRISDCPNIGYPCEKCGRLIQEGVICTTCRQDMKDELKKFQTEEERDREIRDRNERIAKSHQTTYYSRVEK